VTGSQNYVGLDTDVMPTADQLSAIWRLGVRWLGSYLCPAPCHSDHSWMGSREEMEAMGFGLAPVFVGQQCQGPGSSPGNPLVTANQGTIDGLAAATLMLSEGYPPGSYCFLDIEGGGNLEAAMATYAGAWAAAMASRGWGVGFYCAHARAPALAALWPSARIWAVRTLAVGTQANPIVVQPPLCVDQAGNVLAPSGSGYPQATMWQGPMGLDVTLDVNGVPLLVDLSTSLLADPSAP